MLGVGSFNSDSDGGYYYIEKVSNYNLLGSYIEQGSDEVDLFAPVHLPNGAKITKMTYYFNDSTSDGYTLAELVRSQPGSHDDDCELIFFAISGNNDASGDQTLVATEPIPSIAGAKTVDNSKYSYLVHVLFDGDLQGLEPSDDNPPMRTYGALIEYSYY